MRWRRSDRGEIDGGQHHRRYDRHYISLEQVGGHSGAVAHVVAHVIGDGRRVARIVLWDAGFDLADEVAAHVSALCEDAAAETCEDRDERCAKPERNKSVDDAPVIRRKAEILRQNGVVDGDAKKRQACDKKPRHGASFERHGETFGKPHRRRLRRADIRSNRDMHADKARGARQDRADQEPDRHSPGEKVGEKPEDKHANNSDGRVLT